MYLRISIVAWLVMALLLWIWMRLVRPERIGVSFRSHSTDAAELARNPAVAAR